jgi:hypothetical protein
MLAHAPDDVTTLWAIRHRASMHYHATCMGIKETCMYELALSELILSAEQ